jgi:hypothetical protein
MALQIFHTGRLRTIFHGMFQCLLLEAVLDAGQEAIDGFAPDGAEEIERHDFGLPGLQRASRAFASTRCSLVIFLRRLLARGRASFARFSYASRAPH